MASRSSKGLGTGDWGLATPSIVVSAIFAVSAVSSLYVAAAQVPVERARTEALARRATDRLQALQREADRLASQRRTLLGDLATLRAGAEKAQAAAQRAAQSRTDLIRDIDKKRDLNAQLSSELQAAQQKLQGTLRDLAAGAPAAEPAQLPLRPFRGAL